MASHAQGGAGKSEALSLDGRGAGVRVLAESASERRSAANAETTPTQPSLIKREGAKRDKPLHAPGAVGRARHLRRVMTTSERNLWKALRHLELGIRRQTPVGPYIADFVHHATKLVIEIDSARHDLPEQQLHDAERDAWFAAQGYRVVRIRDSQAFGAADEVADRIAAEIQQSPSPNPLPSRERAKT